MSPRHPAHPRSGRGLPAIAALLAAVALAATACSSDSRESGAASAGASAPAGTSPAVGEGARGSAPAAAGDVELCQVLVAQLEEFGGIDTAALAAQLADPATAAAAQREFEALATASHEANLAGASRAPAELRADLDRLNEVNALLLEALDAAGFDPTKADLTAYRAARSDPATTAASARIKAFSADRCGVG